MQIYDAIKLDHREIIQMLDELTSLNEGERTREDLIERIRDAFVPHSRAEEAVFYNSLRSFDVAKELVRDSFREHLEAERLLRLLQLKEKVDLDWKKTANQLKVAISRHIEDEENKLFPVAKNILSYEEAEKLGVAFERMKPEVREEGIMGSTMDLIANLMPPRFTKSAREYRADSWK